jgi:hypothetical protein
MQHGPNAYRQTMQRRQAVRLQQQDAREPRDQYRPNQGLARFRAGNGQSARQP